MKTEEKKQKIRELLRATATDPVAAGRFTLALLYSLRRHMLIPVHTRYQMLLGRCDHDFAESCCEREDRFYQGCRARNAALPEGVSIVADELRICQEETLESLRKDGIAEDASSLLSRAIELLDFREHRLPDREIMVDAYNPATCDREPYYESAPPLELQN